MMALWLLPLYATQHEGAATWALLYIPISACSFMWFKNLIVKYL